MEFMQMEKRGISKLDLKRRNRMQILRIIREYGPISRVDVASALEITRAAVSIITYEMIEEGVLVEIGEEWVFLILISLAVNLTSVEKAYAVNRGTVNYSVFADLHIESRLDHSLISL